MEIVQPKIDINYTYEHVPTIAKFAMDKHRIRGVLGPFGSGKTSGCIWEIIRKSLEQEPGQDGIRHTRWAIVRNCYDDETEILTEKNGWKLFKDIADDDKVATLQDEKLVYEKPDSISVYPHDGEMIGFQNEGVDFLVTPDHEMWVSKRRTRKKIWGDYETIHAQDIYGSQTVRVRKDSKWEGYDLGLSEDIFEYLGFFYAEGSYGVYSDRPRFTLVQVKKSGISYFRELADKIGLTYKENKRTDGIAFVMEQDNPVFKRIRKFLEIEKEGYRSVPKELLAAQRTHLQSFLDGFIEGDGNIYKGTTRIYTSSKQLADDLQEMALKAGTAASIAHRDRRDTPIEINGVQTQPNHIEYCVTVLGEKKHRPILHTQKKSSRHPGWYKKHYKGNVYCAAMKIPTVFVRRNGKAFWCNRTYPQLNDTTIKSVLDWLPPIVFGQYKVAAHEYVITGFKGARIELLFRALDKPEHVSNLLSLELTGVWVNEAREVPKVIVDALDGRIDRYPSNKDGGRTWTGMIMDTNPPDDESWWHKMFETDRPENCMGFKQPSGLSPEAENICAPGKVPEDYPMGHRPGLTADYYTNMAVGKDKTYIDVYIKGQYGYTKEGKPVYESCYNDNLHVSDIPLSPIKGKELLLAFDFGLTPSCIIGQVTPKGFLNILDELISEGMGIQQFVRNIVKPLLNTKYKGFAVRVTGDPAGNQRAQTDEKTCFDVLRAEEFIVTPAESNDLVARIGAVEGFLVRLTDGKPTFQLDPSIKVIRKGFNSGYCYRRIQGHGERFTEEPMKNAYSHPHDALQYLCQFITGVIKKATKSRNRAKRPKRYQPASTKGGY